MARKVIFLLFFGVILFWSGIGLAEVGERFEVDGYKCHISSDKRGSLLHVRSSVKGGESCKKLSISVYLHDDENHICHIVTSINNYSYTGRKFSVSKRVAGNSNRWVVTDLFITHY
jgi:hypothetical protein